MLTQSNNNFGALTISRQIIDQIIEHAFESVEGNLWLANYKGAVSDVLVKIGGFDAIAEKKVEMRDGMLYVRLYVVSRLGESITENCGLVMERIARDVTEMLELPLGNIEIAVTGTVSKNRNIVKRDLTLDLHEMVNTRKISL
ncbi:MAG: Asp23/Gls24 family envelope stress response protein [Firmicutes bacterium]|nr:Asp23/Gls24 family envelope stress response protein [Bacillota bacterium]MBR0209859.1 Asp23/Gls24 family envelope stress response protein [Bacillota bacterium]